MRFPKLTPLQSRFAASMLASIVILVIYYVLSNPHFAYAAELDSIQTRDHNHHRLQQNLVLEEESLSVDQEEEAAFSPACDEKIRAKLDKREDASGSPKPLNDSVPSTDTLSANISSKQYVFKASSQMVYISITTCHQPSTINDPLPPQLTICVSDKPDPNPGNITPISLFGGLANTTFNGGADVYIGVFAPDNTDSLRSGGQYQYELAASNDAYYHSYSDRQSLLLLDTDGHSALFASNNFTSLELGNVSSTPPLKLFAHPANDPAIQGIQYSYCGLQNYAQIQPNVTNSSVTNMTVGLWDSGPAPKQLFYLNGNLNRSQTYMGFMAMAGNSTSGGQVWRSVNFTTKSDGNCQLLFNITTCPNLAHAVPSSPQYLHNFTGLQDLYNATTAALFQNFTYSLQQIPCNTTETSQYSLARTCDDCTRAYRNWLCAVTIPRCTDWTSSAPHLQPRNINPAAQLVAAVSSGSLSLAANATLPSSILSAPTYQPMPSAPFAFPYANQALADALSANASRNALAACGDALSAADPAGCGIDQAIAPGPYKELLPCEDYCYELVRACPASLGFACPASGRGLELSYGVLGPGGKATDAQGNLMCSFDGAVVAGVLEPTGGVGRASVVVGWVLVGLGVGVGAPMGLW